MSNVEDELPQVGEEVDPNVTGQFGGFDIDDAGAEDLINAPKDDWVPFIDRPEFASLPIDYASGRTPGRQSDPQGRVPRGRDARTRDGLTQREQARRTNLDEAASRTQQMRDLMVGYSSGQLDETDIEANYGAGTLSELIGGDFTDGYMQSGYAFQALGTESVGTGTFGVGVTSTINEFHNKTSNEIQSAYQQMTDTERNRFNATLWQSGYYNENEKPTIGRVEPHDAAAFSAFIGDNFRNPDVGMGGIIEQRRRERYAKIREPGIYQELTGDRSGQSASDRTIWLSDPDVIKDAVRQATSNHLGQGIEESAMDAIVSEAMARERASKEQYYASVDAQASSETSPAVEEADMFIDAVNRRRGGIGDLISSEAFPEWASLLTGNPAMENTEENQRELGRRFALANYSMTGSWADVSLLFQDGPGRGSAGYDPFQSVDEEARPASAFSDDVLRNMQDIEQERFGANNSASGTNYNFVESFDATAFAEREVRARNRAQAQTWQFAKQGAEFYDILRRGSLI